MFFRACGSLSGWSTGCGPCDSCRKWGLFYESGARRGDKEERRGAEGTVEEGHMAADPAAANGEGEPEAARWAGIKKSIQVNQTSNDRQCGKTTLDTLSRIPSSILGLENDKFGCKSVVFATVADTASKRFLLLQTGGNASFMTYHQSPVNTIER